MHIAMIGTGYVGLVSGTCFAEFGFNVACVDNDESKIELLRQGRIPIYEPGLDDLVKSNVQKGCLTFTTAIADAVREADVVFIAVGTPTRRGDGYADLRYVFSVAEDIAPHLRDDAVVTIKSTVPVGTGRKVETIIRRANPAARFSMVSNPEFLREGSAIEDFMRPDRVVIGTDSPSAKEIMRQIYRPLYLTETPILFTTLETSELLKYATNAFLATKVAFINEMADLCEKCDADVQMVAKGMGLDGRIGSKFLHAGPGFGGSCFPKDIRALVQTGQDHEARVHIVETVLASNEARKNRMAEKIRLACGGSVEGKTLAVLGVTFKPNTDDMRDSASLSIIPALQRDGATIQAFDPAGMTSAEPLLPGVLWQEDPYAAMTNADAVVVITEWNEFRALDLQRVKTLLKRPLFIDLRNIYTPEEMAVAGFDYVSVGRALVNGFTEGAGQTARAIGA